MRIEIHKEGVVINHGLNDEGRLEIRFRTNDHVTAEVAEGVESSDVTFRQGPFVVEERMRGTVRRRARLVPDVPSAPPSFEADGPPF